MSKLEAIIAAGGTRQVPHSARTGQFTGLDHKLNRDEIFYSEKGEVVKILI